METWYETTTDELQDSFVTDAQTTLRVDADQLVFAAPVELVVGRGDPPLIRLRAGVLPSQMMKLRDRLGLSPLDLAKYKPHEPVQLTWRGGEALVEAYAHARGEGRPLEDCVTSKGPNGFAAFLDLALYEFEHAAQ